MNVVRRVQALSSRERVLLLAAVAIAVVVVVRYGSFGDSSEEESSGSDARWVQVAKIDNYRRIVARADAVEKQSGEIEARYRADQERLSSATTTTQVGAELQGVIGTMAAESGLNVLSSQILKEEEVEGFRRVGVRLTLSGNLQGLAKLLAAIEGGDKDMVVTHLEVNRKLGTVRRVTPSRMPEPATPPPLTVSLEVKTFMRQAT